jgi:hypothetical protein
MGSLEIFQGRLRRDGQRRRSAEWNYGSDGQAISDTGKKSSEEVAGRESKPVLEERREHHNLIRIGCENIFSGGGAPLQHGPIGEERTCNKFAKFFFIHDGRLKEMRMRGCCWCFLATK